MKAKFTKEHTKETKAKITIFHYVHANNNSGDVIPLLSIVSCELYSNTTDWDENIEAAMCFYTVETIQIWELKTFK